MCIRDSLKADFVYVADTNMWNPETPAITTSLRGMAAVEVTLKAASRDLHSGLYGGIALNPINALTRILGDLKDDQGRIQIPHFYDGIAPLPETLRPVSYTHLDVYKRQQQARPVGPPDGRLAGRLRCHIARHQVRLRHYATSLTESRCV